MNTNNFCAASSFREHNATPNKNAQENISKDLNTKLSCGIEQNVVNHQHKQLEHEFHSLIVLANIGRHSLKSLAKPFTHQKISVMIIFISFNRRTKKCKYGICRSNYVNRNKRLEQAVEQLLHASSWDCPEGVWVAMICMLLFVESYYRLISTKWPHLLFCNRAGIRIYNLMAASTCVCTERWLRGMWMM